MNFLNPVPTQREHKRSLLSTLLAFAIILIIATVTSTAVAQDVHPVSSDSDAITEQDDGDEIARLQRGLHGMTMTFIRFAQEHEVDAYEAGRWTGTFLTRYTDESFNPREFLQWMKQELAMHEVQFEVMEDAPDRIEARRERILSREKLPWFYRYGITLGEYEDFYHGALVEIAKAYGLNYTQEQQGNSVLLTIKQ